MKIRSAHKERILNTLRNDPLFKFYAQKACALHQRALGRSDPFAGRRIFAHIMHGIEFPSDVIIEAQAILDARGDKYQYLG